MVRYFKNIVVLSIASALWLDGFAQGWVMDVQIDLHTADCFIEDIATATFTYTGTGQSGSATPSSTQVNLANFSMTGTGSATSGMLTLTAAGKCNAPPAMAGTNIGASRSIAISFPVGTGCTSLYFSEGTLSPGQSGLAVTIWYYPQYLLSTPTVTACQTVNFSSATACSPYEWQVSENGSTGWQTIQTTSSPSATVPLSTIQSASLKKFGVHYARVGTAGRYSAPAGFFVDAPPPVATFGKSDISCFGGNDGKIFIAVSSPVPSVDKFYIKGFHDSNLTDNPDVQIANAVGTSFEINASHIISGLSRILPGKWRFVVENNKDAATYGTCSSVYVDAVNLSEPPELKILPGSSAAAVSCNSGDVGVRNDGSIQLTIQNGSAPYSYDMSSDGGANFVPAAPNSSSTLTPVFNGLTKGNFILRASYRSGAITCVSSPSPVIAVQEPPELNVQLVSRVDVLCKGKNTGAIDVNVTGGNGGYSYAWSGPGTFYSASPDIINLFAGSYALAVTDVKGCKPDAAAFAVSIAEPVSGFSVTASKKSYGGFDMTCAQNDGEISLALANFALPLQSVLWERDGTPFSPANNMNPVNLPPATYTVAIVDNKGCDASAAVALARHPGISVLTEVTSSFNGYATKCATSNEGAGGVKSVVNGFGPYSYLWFDGSAFPGKSGLAKGTYSVLVTDANGCSAGGSLVISSPPAIQPNLQVTSNYNGVPISCAGKADGAMEAFPVNGFGTYRYSWNPVSGVTTKKITGLAQGTYAVRVTDDFGCWAEESKTILEPAAISLALTKKSYNGLDVSCHNAGDGEIYLSVNKGIAPYSYAWSNGRSQKDNIGVSPNIYSVTVTDMNTCRQSGSITIANPAAVTNDIQQTSNFNGFAVSCFGNSDGSVKVITTGGTGAYTYVWSNGATSQVNTGLRAGLHTLTTRDSNGCTNTGSILLTQPDALSVAVEGVTPVSCFGQGDGAIDLAGGGGVTPYLFSLDQISWQEESEIKGLSAGEHTCYLRDANGCIKSVKQTVVQPDPLAIYFQNIVDASCNDAVGAAQAAVTGGTGSYLFSWRDEWGRLLSSAETLDHVSSGVYSVTVVDKKNCTVTDKVAVSSIGGAVFSVKEIRNVSCFGLSDGAASVEVSAGLEPLTYAWSNGQTGKAANSLSPGRHFVTVTDGAGCKALKAFELVSPDEISLTYSITTPRCAGDCDGVIQVTSGGGTSPHSYDWEGLAQSGNEIRGLCAGKFNLKLVDANGCVKTDSVVLQEPAELKTLVKINEPGCLGHCDGSIEIGAGGGTGAYAFRWEEGEGSIRTGLCAGMYSVTVSDDLGCASVMHLEVPQGNARSADLPEQATLCVGQEQVLELTGAWQRISWTSNTLFNSTSEKIRLKEAGMYFLEGIDASGCVVRDTFRLTTSLDLLKAEFLMPAEAVVGDTIVAIDISWPLPERIEWIYPPSFVLLPSAAPEFLFARVPEPGTFNIGMASFLAQCQDRRDKVLTVYADDKSAEGGRLGFEQIVQDYSLYPNPNDGNFGISIKLNEPLPAQLLIVQFPTGLVQAQWSGELRSNYRVDFSLSALPQGVYAALLRVGSDSRAIRFVKR